MFDEFKDILTVSDLQNILNIGRNSVLKLLNSGEIKGRKIAHQWRITKGNLINYIENI